jgi:hypothetical protein
MISFGRRLLGRPIALASLLWLSYIELYPYRAKYHFVCHGTHISSSSVPSSAIPTRAISCMAFSNVVELTYFTSSARGGLFNYVALDESNNVNELHLGR